MGEAFHEFNRRDPWWGDQSAPLDRKTVGSCQLHLLFRPLPHDPRHLPHFHIQVTSYHRLSWLHWEGNSYTASDLLPETQFLDSDPEKNKLTADLIFTSLSLFNLIRTPLTLFPFALMDTIKLFVRLFQLCGHLLHIFLPVSKESKTSLMRRNWSSSPKTWRLNVIKYKLGSNVNSSYILFHL